MKALMEMLALQRGKTENDLLEQGLRRGRKEMRQVPLATRAMDIANRTGEQALRERQSVADLLREQAMTALQRGRLENEYFPKTQDSELALMAAKVPLAQAEAARQQLMTRQERKYGDLDMMSRYLNVNRDPMSGEIYPEARAIVARRFPKAQFPMPTQEEIFRRVLGDKYDTFMQFVQQLNQR